MYAIVAIVFTAKNAKLLVVIPVKKFIQNVFERVEVFDDFVIVVHRPHPVHDDKNKMIAIAATEIENTSCENRCFQPRFSCQSSSSSSSRMVMACTSKALHAGQSSDSPSRPGIGTAREFSLG